MNLPRTGLTFASFVLALAGGTSAADGYLTGVWNGTGLTGHIKEPNTFGEGDDPYLHADVAINVDPEARTLSFTKKYDGTGKVAHEVNYSGLLSTDGARVSGKWEIPEVWGARFTLQRVGDREAGEKLSEKIVARKEPLPTP